MWRDYGESRNNARPESDFVDLDDTNEGIERKKAEYTTSSIYIYYCYYYLLMPNNMGRGTIVLLEVHNDLIYLYIVQ